MHEICHFCTSTCVVYLACGRTLKICKYIDVEKVKFKVSNHGKKEGRKGDRLTRKIIYSYNK